MHTTELIATTEKLMCPGKGILAADESNGTIAKRFQKIGVACTEESRRDYRELLFRTTAAMKECISGVILFDETIRQNAADGTPLIRLIEDSGSIPGIKVDKGTSKLAEHRDDTVTEGLDGLRDRFVEYYKLGARFAKWRAVFKISDNSPGQFSINSNASALAQYALLAQENGLVPIVEPEVLMDGDHDIHRCEQVTSEVLETVFWHLSKANVTLEAMLLKPNMVLPSLSAPEVNAALIAEATIRVLKRYVPAAVPGIVFLSGGQSEEQATKRLCAINEKGSLPWTVSFSFGRALQESAQIAWGGKVENVAAAQVAFTYRAKRNSLASRGMKEE